VNIGEAKQCNRHQLVISSAILRIFVRRNQAIADEVPYSIFRCGHSVRKLRDLIGHTAPSLRAAIFMSMENITLMGCPVRRFAGALDRHESKGWDGRVVFWRSDVYLEGWNIAVYIQKNSNAATEGPAMSSRIPAPHGKTHSKRRRYPMHPRAQYI